jgi:hypothetical protein
VRERRHPGAQSDRQQEQTAAVAGTERQQRGACQRRCEQCGGDEPIDRQYEVRGVRLIAGLDQSGAHHEGRGCEQADDSERVDRRWLRSELHPGLRRHGHELSVDLPGGGVTRLQE